MQLYYVMTLAFEDGFLHKNHIIFLQIMNIYAEQCKPLSWFKILMQWHIANMSHLCTSGVNYIKRISTLKAD